MKTLIALTLVVLSILATGAFAQTQEKTGPQPRTAPESKLVEFHMALLKRGPGLRSSFLLRLREGSRSENRKHNQSECY